MHRKPKEELLPFDTKLDRTLRNPRKVKRVESTTMVYQRERIQPILEELEAERPQMQMSLKDFWRLVIQDEYSAVRQAAIEANNFELKPALITMVQQQQFTGHPSEDPHKHMGRFMRMTNTVTLIGERPEVIKLQLFPLSLRDMAIT